MAASGVLADFNDARSLLHHFLPSSPESTNSAVLRAIKSMNRDTEAHNVSTHEYIDPKSALSPPPCDPFGQGILLSSSKVDQISEVESQLEGVSGLPTTIVPQDDFGFSSCDEDAEGEPDESFHSEHSFWATHAGDTSASTVATLDVDDTPIPLLGRDGKWKGVQPQILATRDDDQGEQPRQDPDEDSKQSRQHDDVDRSIGSTLLYSNSSKTTQKKRSASVSGSESGVLSSRSAGKKRKKAKDNSLVESLGSSKPGLKRTPKKQSNRSKASKSAASSSALGLDELRHGGHASSDAGSMTSARNVSFPASSTGRYKLRKKNSVPKLNLASLLTPPRAQSSDDAVKDSAEWLDQVDQELGKSMDATRAPTPPKAEALVVVKEDADEMPVELDELDPNPTRPVMVRDKGRRTFPADWEIHPDFPLLYQRYCVPSSVSPEVLEMLLRGLNYANVDDEFHETVDRAQTVHGAFNKPRSILDIYTPRFVKGVGPQKVGMCPVCYEDGKVKFLKTKFSAYNYHMQNFHGISALTGLPFTPPTKFRTKARPNAKPKERKELVQGWCHSCSKWIDVQGPKETEVKVAEIYWWKHAQVCHRSDKGVPEGVGGWFVENKWWERVKSVLALVGGIQGELEKLWAGNK